MRLIRRRACNKIMQRDDILVGTILVCVVWGLWRTLGEGTHTHNSTVGMWFLFEVRMCVLARSGTVVCVTL